MKSELDEINQNRLQSGTDCVKVHSMEVYEMLLQLKQDFQEMVEVQVETKYKTVAKKVKRVATPLPKGSNEVIEEASPQSMLRDPKNVGHKFIEETLKQLQIDEDGFLTNEEDFQEMVEVQVETKYKTLAKKVKPVATPLSEGSNEVIEEASPQSMLRDPKNVGHKFTEETLEQLQIDEDGFLTDEEVKCF
ncbi:hypothetical protein L7F22_001886 [Adiantum nelumboides]|nr:hypothetical protein [Adiantum nelumboides]